MTKKPKISTDEKIKIVMSVFTREPVYNFIRASVLPEFKEAFTTHVNTIEEQEDRHLRSKNHAEDYIDNVATVRESTIREAQNSVGGIHLNPEQHFIVSTNLELNTARQIKSFSATLYDTLESDEARSEYRLALTEFGDNILDNENLITFLSHSPRVLDFLYKSIGWFSEVSQNRYISSSEVIKKASLYISDSFKEQDLTEQHGAEIAEQFLKIEDFFQRPASKAILSSMVDNFERFSEIMIDHKLLDSLRSQMTLLTQLKNQINDENSLYLNLRDNKNAIKLMHDLVTSLNKLPQENTKKLTTPEPIAKRIRAMAVQEHGKKSRIELY